MIFTEERRATKTTGESTPARVILPHPCPKQNVLKHLSSGKNVLFDIDWQGTQQLKKRAKDQKLVTIFILPPEIEVLRNRLVNRDQDGKQLAERRMKIFKKEVLHWD